MSGNQRIRTDGGAAFGHNPFEGLSGAALPPGPADPPPSPAANAATGRGAPKSRGRVDIVRQRAGRGGKTVTVVTGFMGISPSEKEQLAKAMQKACGSGGTVKDGNIEIQGEHRDEVARILSEARFRPVFAGGWS